jgi:DNA-binding NtrC family response regulator
VQKEACMEDKLILLVDDEPDICSELSQFLTTKCYKVITAENGKKGLALFRKLKPDVVISDYKMPVMNGFELLLHIKRINKSVKVILVSAVVDLDPFVLTKNSSSFDFMDKPVDLNKLLEMIKKE